jgi:hypothetical protein
MYLGVEILINYLINEWILDKHFCISAVETGLAFLIPISTALTYL